MKSKEIINYLANLITIANADGFIDKKEEATIERVYKEIMAKKRPCPGSRIRSKGKGRGLGVGRGRGPIGRRKR